MQTPAVELHIVFLNPAMYDVLATRVVIVLSLFNLA